MKDYKHLFILPNLLVLFVIPFSILGISPIIIDIGKSLKVNPEDLVLLFSFFLFGSVIGHVAVNFFNFDGIIRHIIIISLVIILLIINIFISYSFTLVKLYSLFILMGFIGGIYSILVYENILYINSKALFYLAQSLIPFSTIVSTKLASYLIIKQYDWILFYRLISILLFLIILAYLILLIRYKKEIYSSYGRIRRNKIDIKSIFINIDKKLFLLIFFGIIFYSISESILLNWSSTFLRLKFFSLQVTSNYLIILWTSMGIGRITINLLFRNKNPYLLLFISSILSIVAILYFMFSNSEINIYISALLMGFSLSVIYPGLLFSGTMLINTNKKLLLSMFTIFSMLGLSIGPVIVKITIRYSIYMSISISIIIMMIVVVILFKLLICGKDVFKNFKGET